MSRVTLLCFSIFFSVIGNAQNFFYSAPVGNDNVYTDAKVIGRVKKNIVICKSTWSIHGRRSEILVYDDKMKLLNTASLDSIVSQFAFVDFINEKDSFAAIIQDKGVHPFVYKLISFDAGGNILNNKVLETSESAYEIVKSATSNFALLKVVRSNINGTIAIHYDFVNNNTLIHSDTIILPFNELSSTLGEEFLDNDNLVIPVNDTSAIGGTLALFKVDLNNNSSINTIRNLNNDFLIPGSLAISENANHYTVTASAANNYQDLNAISKIFLWQIIKDLTDISSDTVFANVDSISPCLQDMFSYQLNNFAMSDNSSAIIISPSRTDFFSDNMQRVNNQGSYSPVYSNSGGGVPSAGGGFYEGRVLSTTGYKEFNGNGSYNTSNVAHGPTWSNNGPASSGYNKRSSRMEPQAIALAVLGVDDKSNLNWNKCFDVSMEKDFMSLMNEATFINTQHSLHIIYPKTLGKNKQSISDITINQDGSYVITPIITMDLKYKYMLAQSVPLDSNSIIVPCTIKGKLAFAKLVIK